MSTTKNALRIGILKALRDGPWSSWELAVILGVHNKHLVSSELLKLKRKGLINFALSRKTDQATGGSCIQYARSKR
jgi:hypothetical protein